MSSSPLIIDILKHVVVEVTKQQQNQQQQTPPPTLESLLQSAKGKTSSEVIRLAAENLGPKLFLSSSSTATEYPTIAHICCKHGWLEGLQFCVHLFQKTLSEEEEQQQQTEETAETAKKENNNNAKPRKKNLKDDLLHIRTSSSSTTTTTTTCNEEDTGLTCLALACDGCFINIVKYLVEVCEIDPNDDKTQKTDLSFTPTLICCRKNHLLLKRLNENENNKNNNNNNFVKPEPLRTLRYLVHERKCDCVSPHEKTHDNNNNNSKGYFTAHYLVNHFLDLTAAASSEKSEENNNNNNKNADEEEQTEFDDDKEQKARRAAEDELIEMIKIVAGEGFDFARVKSIRDNKTVFDLVEEHNKDNKSNEKLHNLLEDWKQDPISYLSIRALLNKRREEEKHNSKLKHNVSELEKDWQREKETKERKIALLEKNLRLLQQKVAVENAKKDAGSNTVRKQEVEHQKKTEQEELAKNLTEDEKKIQEEKIKEKRIQESVQQALDTKRHEAQAVEQQRHRAFAALFCVGMYLLGKWWMTTSSSSSSSVEGQAAIVETVMTSS